MFSRLGVPVLSADEMAKELMTGDASLRRSLTALLGLSAYDPDGLLNRQYIASRIFSSSGLQRKVNALVHPRVEAEVGRQFAKLEEAGNRIGIVEAALIYEAGFEKELDYVIVVDSPEADRIQRVVDRDKVAPEDVRKRIQAQSPAASKLRKADYIIRNTGSISDLDASVRFIYSLLQIIAGKQ